MKAADKIEPQDWMTDHDTRAVMNALQGGMEEPLALFVGGCVRNVLLDKEVTDIDIATKLSPDAVMDRLRKNAIKALPTGIDHGTITAVRNSKHFEITTLRKDVETDGRRAVVAFSEDWQDDARRRDFTMNTLLADAQGHIYDPLGQGLEDLQARRVIFVGDPATRIAEDVLRILRFFRFHLYYGQGAPDESALKACGAAADKIQTLSKERISQEFFKVLDAPDPLLALDLMFANGVLCDLPHQDFERDALRTLCKRQAQYQLPSLAARLFVLAGQNPGHDYAEFLIIPKAILKKMQGLAQLPKAFSGDEKSLKRTLYMHGRETTLQGVLLSNLYEEDLSAAIDFAQQWEIPVFPLTGDDLIAAGIAPGPALGEAMKKAETFWIESDFQASPEECLNFARR